MEHDDFDPPLTTDALHKIAQLSALEIAQIDQMLIANTATQWRKVARVVGISMLGLNSKFEGIPDIYYSQRIAKLVAKGKLQAQGDLRKMRCSEVRLR